MFYYINAADNQYKIAFNSKGGVQGLYGGKIKDRMTRNEVVHCVFGPDVNVTMNETWQDLFDMAIQRIMESYYIQTKGCLESASQIQPGANFIKEPFMFEGSDITCILEIDGQPVVFYFNEEDDVWERSSMQKFVLETIESNKASGRL